MNFTFRILGVTFLVAEIVSLKGNFTFTSVAVLVFVLLRIVSSVIGLVGIYMKIENLLAPILCLEIIYIVVSGVSFIFFIFLDKFSLSVILDDFASQHNGAFVILFLIGLGLSIYSFIILFIVYMHEYFTLRALFSNKRLDAVCYDKLENRA